MTIHPLKLFTSVHACWRWRAHPQLFVIALRRVGAGRARSRRPLPGDLKKAPFLDSWIRVGADGKITVFTGKSELGQGIKTALRQVAAEELSVKFRRDRPHHLRYRADCG